MWLVDAEYDDQYGKPVNRYGHLLSFCVRGGAEKARAFFDALQRIWRATDLGRIKSVATIPAISTHQQQGEAGRAMAGIPANMVRLCVGGEHPADIIADLDQACTRRNSDWRNENCDLTVPLSPWERVGVRGVAEGPPISRLLLSKPGENPNPLSDAWTASPRPNPLPKGEGTRTPDGRLPPLPLLDVFLVVVAELFQGHFDHLAAFQFEFHAFADGAAEFRLRVRDAVGGGPGAKRRGVGLLRLLALGASAAAAFVGLSLLFLGRATGRELPAPPRSAPLSTAGPSDSPRHSGKSLSRRGRRGSTIGIQGSP